MSYRLDKSKIRVTFGGVPQMKQRLQTVAREFPLAARRGTKEWAIEKLLTPAVSAAPELTGRLKRSGRLQISIRKKAGQENITVFVIFGGGPERVRHALIVHETHKTKSKYLERAILAAVPTAGPEIAEKIHLKKLAMAR
jgi:hypothetical protein